MPAMERGARVPLLEAQDLTRYFSVGTQGVFRSRKRVLKAVDGVSLDIMQGETLGVVGESGSGKSTLGRLILRLLDPTSGALRFRGRDILELKSQELREFRRRVQVVFQDPYSSLNPRMNIGNLIAEPIVLFERISHAQALRRVEGLLEQVGLDPAAARRYPHEFSGGQRQRIAIAAGVAMNPEVLVADEPVSALDVSVQAQILNLLGDLKQQLDLTYIFISHDLNVVLYFCDRVAVMYLGRMVEIAPSELLGASPLHPYTQHLLGAVPGVNPGQPRERIILQGEVPSPMALPTGCRFHTRCPVAWDRCRTDDPPLRQVIKDHFVACHLVNPEIME